MEIHKEIHERGRWTLELYRTDSDPSIGGDLDYKDEFWGSVSGALMTGELLGDGDKVKIIPDTIIEWVEDLESKFYDQVQAEIEAK